MLVLSLSGCLRTYIEPISVDSTVQSLALANESPLIVTVAPVEEQRTVGHQYLFLAIPFGRVTIQSVSNEVFKAAFSELSLVGIKPILASAEGGTQFPHLQLDVKEVQASAYDFLFLRWIKTHVVIEAQFKDRAGHTKSMLLQGSESSWKQFAFSKHLSFYFHRALKKAFEPLPDLTGRRHALERD